VRRAREAVAQHGVYRQRGLEGAVALLQAERASSGVARTLRRSEGQREVVERDANSIMDRHLFSECVVAAAQVLHERMPSSDRVR